MMDLQEQIDYFKKHYYYGEIVKTGLEYTEKNSDILRSVLGQISDGVWEESQYMNKKYGDRFMIVGSDIGIKYSTNSPEKVIDFFAKKIYTIARIDCEMDYEKQIKDRIYKEKGLDPNAFLLQRGENESEEEFFKRIDDYKEGRELVEEEVKANPLNFKKVFNANNDRVCECLNYHSGVTVADAFNVYNQLKDKVRVLNVEKEAKIKEQIEKAEKECEQNEQENDEYDIDR